MGGLLSASLDRRARGAADSLARTRRHGVSVHGAPCARRTDRAARASPPGRGSDPRRLGLTGTCRRRDSKPRRDSTAGGDGRTTPRHRLHYARSWRDTGCPGGGRARRLSRTTILSHRALVATGGQDNPGGRALGRHSRTTGRTHTARAAVHTNNTLNALAACVQRGIVAHAVYPLVGACAAIGAAQCRCHCLAWARNTEPSALTANSYGAPDSGAPTHAGAGGTGRSCAGPRLRRRSLALEPGLHSRLAQGGPRGLRERVAQRRTLLATLAPLSGNARGAKLRD